MWSIWLLLGLVMLFVLLLGFLLAWILMKVRRHSFKYAWNGLKILFQEEPNAVTHGIVASMVAVMGLLLDLSAIEWTCLVLSIGLVLVLEISNTAIENLSDFLSPNIHPQIAKTKDLMAAAVLTSSFMAAMVGLIIFIPKLWEAL